MTIKRTIGHFNREARLNEIRRRRLERANKTGTYKHTTPGLVRDLNEVTTHIYSDDEIRVFDISLAIKNHPLSRKPTNLRSKLAYREIMQNVNVSPKYMLPGMFAIFGYKEPKTKEELEYYDATPGVIFFGITRTKTSAIREIGFNLHYFPPYIRGKIIEIVFNTFRQYYTKYFNEVPSRPNRMVSYPILKKLLDRYKIGFGLRMYIPVLRGKTYILPSRLVSTMAFTEGHFNGATLKSIRRKWRKR